MREIRMLRAMRRALETESRSFLNGHEGRSPDTAKELPTDLRASARPYHVGEWHPLEVSGPVFSMPSDPWTSMTHRIPDRCDEVDRAALRAKWQARWKQ